MHLEKQPDLGVRCSCVVGDASSVGRSHLNKTGAAPFHDVGHPERAAYLHQLAPADQDLAPAGNRVQAEQDGSGVVIYYVRSLSAAHACNLGGHVVLTRSSFACCQVELKIGIPSCALGHSLSRVIRKRSSAQIGMEDYPGGIDHWTRARGRAPFGHGRKRSQDRVEDRSSGRGGRHRFRLC